MQAAVIYANGGIEEVKMADVPAPVPQQGEVLLEVRAAALNHLDIWMRKGRPGMEFDFPHILASDACGTIRQLGEGVSGLEQGQRVIVNPGVWCGACEWCLRGEQSECLHYGLLGMIRPGTAAEQVAVSAQCVTPAPAHLNDHEAAALTLDHLTAFRMLIRRAQLRPGEWVLIHGIGGGAALAALQWTAYMGARAIVTSSSDEKLEWAKRMGAEGTINYKTKEDVAKAAREITGGRGVDVCFDSVGGATFDANLRALRRGGRAVHCGVTSGPEATVNISRVYWNHLSILGSSMGSAEDFRLMAAAVGAAGMRPVVDQVFPLAAYPAAMARLEEGAQFGKIVVTP